MQVVAALARRRGRLAGTGDGARSGGTLTFVGESEGKARQRAARGGMAIATSPLVLRSVPAVQTAPPLTTRPFVDSRPSAGSIDARGPVIPAITSSPVSTSNPTVTIDGTTSPPTSCGDWRVRRMERCIRPADRVCMLGASRFAVCFGNGAHLIAPERARHTPGPGHGEPPRRRDDRSGPSGPGRCRRRHAGRRAARDLPVSPSRRPGRTLRVSTRRPGATPDGGLRGRDPCPRSPRDSEWLGATTSDRVRRLAPGAAQPPERRRRPPPTVWSAGPSSLAFDSTDHPAGDERSHDGHGPRAARSLRSPRGRSHHLDRRSRRGLLGHAPLRGAGGGRRGPAPRGVPDPVPGRPARHRGGRPVASARPTPSSSSSIPTRPTAFASMPARRGSTRPAWPAPWSMPVPRSSP